MPIHLRIIRRLLSILIGWLKYVPFPFAMRIRNRLYGHVLNKMGQSCNIADAVTITAPANLSLGNRVSIHPYCVFAGSGEIEIGNGVAIASSCILISESHIFDDAETLIKDQGLEAQPIRIGNDVWLGARVTVLGNVTINDGAVIGAGSVVTRDIPANSVAVGVPCQVVRTRGKSTKDAKS